MTTPSPSDVFRESLQALLKSKRITVAELARLSSVKDSTLRTTLKSGAIQLDTATAIARGVGTTVSTMTGDTHGTLSPGLLAEIVTHYFEALDVEGDLIPPLARSVAQAYQVAHERGLQPDADADKIELLTQLSASQLRTE